MASLNFYLKGAISVKRITELKRNDNNKTLNELLEKPLQIFLKVSTFGQRIQIYTKRRIAQKYWDSKKQQYSQKKYKKDCAKNNEWLNELQDVVSKFVEENERRGKRTKSDEIKSLLENKIYNKTTIKDTFDELFKAFLNEHKTKDGYSLKSGTISNYKGLYNHLNNYASKYRIKLDAKDFDVNFLLGFRNYLLNDNGLSDNTVAKILTTSKVFIRYLIKKDVIKYFDMSDIKTSNRDGEIYVLPLKQVIELQNAEIESERLQKVRDIFCFQALTGQRFSDIEAINKNDIYVNEEGKKVWGFITIKTQEHIVCPIIEYTEEILEKYKDLDRPLPIISEQKMNVYLKELGELIGFTKNTKIVKYYDGVKRETYVPFYKVLTTHVARKSFITNSLILGIPERIVREISGHKDEKSFKRYVKLAESYKTEIISKAYSKENIEKVLIVN